MEKSLYVENHCTSFNPEISRVVCNPLFNHLLYMSLPTVPALSQIN